MTEKHEEIVEVVEIIKADGTEEILIEIIDIEEFTKTSTERKPKAKKYHIRVDTEKFVVDVPEMTGRQILELARKTPPEQWMLNQKIHKKFDPVGLDQVVDFTAPGVERFTTLPKEQTEGRPALRRLFSLPEEDTDALDAAGVSWETVTDGSSKWVIIHLPKLPDSFLDRETSVAIQIPATYPAASLDMAYFNPPILRVDGRAINRTEATVLIEGKSWQRWSRHYSQANPWKSGEYNIYTHFLLSQSWLEKEAQKGKAV